MASSIAFSSLCSKQISIGSSKLGFLQNGFSFKSASPSPIPQKSQSLGTILAIAATEKTLFEFDEKNGKVWVIRLLAVACLSLAAKMEERKVPALSEYYYVDENNFESDVIQRMELLVLNNLEWKMGSITPFEFLHYFITKFCDDSSPPKDLATRAIELIYSVMKGSRTKRVSNMVKMPSAVLKFIVDASMMDLVSHSQTRCLNFTLEYLEFIISSLRHLQFKEDDLKETFLCVKSSFTYATKLLNLVLKGSSETSPPQPEAYFLSNKLLHLIISVEEHMGSGYAARIVASAKPWLPDLILGLGSWNILKRPPRKSTRYFGPDHVKSNFPSWPTILAKVELIEIGSEYADDDTISSEEFPAFRKLMGVMIQLLRTNHDVLDAVGVIFLTGSIVGLERKDFQLVLGLLHFVCAKLVGAQRQRVGRT